MDLEAYISFPDLEGEISELIGKKLTIGSEIGELVLQDESISPRHCTLIQNQKIISIIDHSSIGGTYINKKKLEPARTFIVSDKDKIRIGKIQAKIEFKEVPKPMPHLILEAQELGENEIINEEYTDIVSKLPSLDSLKSENLEGEAEIEAENKTHSDLELKDISLIQEHASMGVDISKLLKNPTKMSEDTLMPSSENDLGRFFSEENELPKEDRTNINTVDVERVELDPDVLKYLNKSSVKKEIILSKSKRQRQMQTNTAGTKQKIKKISRYYESSAHVFFRFFAFLFDSLFCLSIFNIFLVYTDFKNFLVALGDFYLEAIYTPFVKNYWVKIEFFVPMFKGIVDDFSSYTHFHMILAFIIFVFVFRVLSTFVFGHTLGSVIVGIKSNGNALIKRIAGVVREIIGWPLAIFILFDLPTFFSKRSFKEVITGTQLYTPSKASSILLTMFFLPIIISLYCFSPMFKGLETLPTINVQENKIEVKPWQYQDKLHSSLLSLSYDSTKELLTLPSFKVQVKNKKTYLSFGLVFVDLKKGRTLEIRKTKDFSLQSIYKGFTDENYLSQYFWPGIHALVHDVAIKNDNFTLKNKLSDNVIIETKKIIKSIYSLELAKIPEFIIANGPIMAGHRDFREKLESLYSSSPESLQLTSFAGESGLFTTHSEGLKKTYAFIPLETINTRLYVFSIDIMDPTMSLFVNHFKNESRGNLGERELVEDPISKLVSGFKKDAAFESVDLSQQLYERYFFIASEFLKRDDSVLIEFLVHNINGTLSVLGEKKENNKKLFLNLTELLESLKNKNMNFFNLDTKRTVSI